jgi:flagellar motor switch protein FliN/FliY
MTKKKKMFEDPLSGVDPIMEDAFSGSEVSSGPEVEPEGEQAVSHIEFPILQNEPTGQSVVPDLLKNIPIEVSVELGRAKVSLNDIYGLAEGSVIDLDRLVGEPLDLVVNGQAIGHGEVVAVDNRYGLRLTNMVAKARV